MRHAPAGTWQLPRWITEAPPKLLVCWGRQQNIVATSSASAKSSEPESKSASFPTGRKLAEETEGSGVEEMRPIVSIHWL